MLMDLLISSITYIHLSIQVSKLDQFVGHDKFGIAFEYMLSIQLKFAGIWKAPYIHENRRDMYASYFGVEETQALTHIYYLGVGQVLCLLACVKCKVSAAPK